VCGGRAGSMNVVDLEHGLIGCFGIVGGSIAAATGAALALKGSGNVAVAFFGDGAINQAYFYECLNFAKVFALPALYVCENNVYGEYTRSEEVTAGTARARAEAMEVPITVVDGNDLWAVRNTAEAALEGVRGGAGPAFVEALTYRFVGHSRSDAGRYRPEGELDRWRERDPLVVARTRLIEEGLGAEELDALETGVPHALSNGSGDQVAWLEVSAPNPDASLEDTVFTEGEGATPEVPFRRGHFDVAELPEPSDAILAGAGTNVGGASVRLLVNAAFGASQLVLMALRYVPGGAIKEHDHAFEEGFFIVEGELEADLDGEQHTF